MSKSRMIYVAVLAIALMVLMWDKLANDNSLSGPQAAEAVASPARPLPPARPSPPDIDPAPNPSVPLASTNPPPALAGLLNAMFGQSSSAPTVPEPPAGSGRFRDLFAMAPPETNTDPTTQETIVAAHKAVALDMQLNGTLVLKGSSTASINGKTYAQGDYIGPYCVKEIAENHVVLASDKLRTKLFLEP